MNHFANPIGLRNIFELPCMWGICWWISGQIGNLLGTVGTMACLAQVGGAMAGGIVMLYLACRVLRVKEMNDLIRAIRGRFLRR